MPSIFKRPNSPFYFCSYRAADGRWLKKSTKANSRKTALEACLAFQRAEDNARAGTATTAQLRKVFNEVLARVGDEPLENDTIREFLEQWLSGINSTSSAGTAERYRKPIADFLKHIGDRSRLPIRSVTQSDVQSWRDAELALGKSPVTVNLLHKVIAAAFASATRRGLLPHNPARAFGYLLSNSHKTKKEAFTEDEIEKLIAATASRDWKGAIIMGSLTGLRLGDIMRLKWGNVDLVSQTIKLVPQKTARHGTELEIPMHPKVEAFILKHPPGKTDADPVFPDLARLSGSGRSGASMQFKRIMEKAGISSGDGKAARGAAGRSTSAKSFHSLRHGFISALANAEVGIEVRKKLAGHTEDATSLGYTHAQAAQLRKAINKL